MLELKNLSIAYHLKDSQLKDSQQKRAVNILNLHLQEGEVLAIVGESGSGKTSILRSIMGLLPKETEITGDILYKKSSILKLSENKMNALRGEEIATVFQDSGLSLNPLRKIGSQFIQYIKIHRKMNTKEADELAQTMLKKMNLENSADIMNSYTFNLSGGMRQRVGIAMAMALKPQLLLLDEPTSALDMTTQAQVVEEILKLRAEYNTSILMITHDIPLAIYMADRIIILKDGEIIETNSASEILNNPQQEYTKELLAHIPKFEEANYAT